MSIFSYFKTEPKKQTVKAETAKSPPKEENMKISLPKLKRANKSYEYRLEDGVPHKDIPPKHGELSLPKIKDGCLNGIIVSVSGTLEHFTRAEIRSLLQISGARLVGSVSAKVDLFIRGCIDVAQDKEIAAISSNIPIIDEDGLLTLFKDLSGDQTEEKPVVEEIPIVVKEPDNSINPIVNIQAPKIDNSASFGLNQKETDDLTMLTEKYRPKALTELVGNDEAINKIVAWLKGYSKSDKKAVLISGPPGIGKSTAAHVIAKKEGYHVIEFNASDVRNKDAIQNIAKTLFDGKSLYQFNESNESKKTAIIFDEIDGMSSGDRGGVQALASFIGNSKNPVLCICNDRYCEKLKPLIPLVIDIPFKILENIDMAQRLSNICKSEGIQLNREKLFGIINKSKGDMRSALNSLHLWRDSVNLSDSKDPNEFDSIDAFAAAKLIVKEKSFEKQLSLFMTDYSSVPDMIHDTLMFNGNVNMWANALDSISLGNVMHNRAFNDGEFSLIESVGVVSSILPSKLNPPKIIPPMKFPECYSRNNKKKKFEQFIQDFCFRSSRNISIGRSILSEGVADLLALRLSIMFNEENDEEIMKFIEFLEITKDDLFQIQEIADFGKQTFVQANPKFKAKLTRDYEKQHPQSQKSYSSQEDERSSYYIKEFGSSQGKRKKK